MPCMCGDSECQSCGNAQGTQELSRRLSAKQVETLKALARYQAVIGHTITLDSLVQRGLLRYDRGFFFLTTAGFRAVGRDEENADAL